MTNLILSFLICFLMNTLVYYSVSAVVSNYYLASMLTSIIIAFLYSIFSAPGDRKGMFRDPGFYIRFFGSAILFLFFDAIFFIL